MEETERNATVRSLNAVILVLINLMKYLYDSKSIKCILFFMTASLAVTFCHATGKRCLYTARCMHLDRRAVLLFCCDNNVYNYN